ncbi:unnamed protein product [Rotaria magnacalcarata]
MDSQGNNKTKVQTVLVKFDSALRGVDVIHSESRVITSVNVLKRLIVLLKDMRECPDEYGIAENASVIMNHHFYLYIRDTVISIIEMLNEASSKILDFQTQFLNEASFMILGIIEHATSIEIFQNLFVIESLIKPIGKCLNAIASNGKHLANYDIVFSIKCLLEAFGKYRKRTNNNDHPLLLLLLDAATTCLCSHYYLEVFNGMDMNATLFYKEQDLFLSACPTYVYEYGAQSQKHKINMLSETVLSHSQKLFEKFQSSKLKRCQNALLHAFINLLNVLDIIPSDLFIESLPLVDAMILIVRETKLLIDDTNAQRKQQKVELIFLALKLIHRVSENLNILRHIQNLNGVTEIFEKLSIIGTTRESRIQSQANLIFDLLISNQDIEEENLEVEAGLCTKDFISEQPLSPIEYAYYQECKEYYNLTGQPIISVASEVFDDSIELPTSSLKICIDEDHNHFDLQQFLTKFCDKINVLPKDIIIKQIQVGSIVCDAEIFHDCESSDKKISIKMICQLITDKFREEFGKMKIFFMFLGSSKTLSKQQKYRADIKINPQYNRIYARGHTYWRGALNDRRDRGNQPYYCPVGWKRCAFYVTDNFYEKFKGWCICYHGTKFACGLSILLSGLKPANKAVHGAGIYASPSITYTSHPRYAEVKRINSSSQSKFFKSGKYVQFVLECRVHPSNIIKIDKETLAAGDTTIDFNIENKIIEWVIDNQNKSIVNFNDPEASIVCTGIMMRVTDDHPGLLPESQWWYSSHLCNYKKCCLLGTDLNTLEKKRLAQPKCNIIYD